MEEGLPISVENVPLSLAIVALALLGLAFYSSAEAAIISAREVRLRKMAEDGSAGAKAALRLREKHDKLFATVLLTEDFLTIFASSFGTALALSLFATAGLSSALGVALATVVMTVLAVIIGALTPKTFATANAERWSTIVAPVVEWTMRLETLFIWLFTLVSNGIIWLLGGRRRRRSPFVTEEEIRILIDIGEQEGTVDEAEREMIENVFTFSERQVREIMTPRTELVAISRDATIGDALDLFSQHPFSRFPVYEGDVDHITGLIEARDLLVQAAQGALDRDRPVAPLERPVYFVPEMKPLSQLLPEMQAQRAEVAVVIDEYGGTAGLVTLEQVIEEIVGDIIGPRERHEAEIQTIDESTTLIDAGMRIDEANEQLGLQLPDGPYDTVAGYVLHALGHIPVKGEQVDLGKLRLVVSEMDGVRIEKLLIERLPPAA